MDSAVLQQYLDLNQKIIIFGLPEKDVDFFPKMLLLLLKKVHIYMFWKFKLLGLFGFQNFLRSVYIDQEYIAKPIIS